MQLSSKIREYINGHAKEAYDLLIELAQIPAPSNREDERALFCCDWLKKQGAEGVYIDEVQNVIYPIGCEGDVPVTVYMAHSDVVFSDTAPLPLTVSDGKIYCPGVGDDTANVVALLMTAKYLAENTPPLVDGGVLLVVNSGEEGIGDLRGSREIMRRYGDRIREFVTFDGGPATITNRAVGSKKYRIEFDTEGGHSYNKFGNRNAIVYMASLIGLLYSVKLPEVGKTTYNVGTISGGTAINAIAQHAEMLYEFRSYVPENLPIMQRHLDAALECFRAKGVKVTLTLIGDRPCGIPVDEGKHTALMDRGAEAIKNNFGFDVKFGSGSTDCNIPLSQGIPAVRIGCVIGKGAHTRDEYVEIDSLVPGLGVAFEMILHHFNIEQSE